MLFLAIAADCYAQGSPLSLTCSGVSGAKEKQQIYDAFENIYAVLKMFKKGDVPAPTEPGSVALVSRDWQLQCSAIINSLLLSFSCAGVCVFDVDLCTSSGPDLHLNCVC